MAAKMLEAIVTHRAEVAPGLIIIQVTPDGWELPDFDPGQFAVLALPGSAPRIDPSIAEEDAPDPDKLIRRAYSIASSSKARTYLEFYVALVSTGALTSRLFALELGDRVWLGPKISGILTLQDVPQDSHLILIATGTGIAPYMSMVRTFVARESDRCFAVIHGAYHSWDLGYRDELTMLDKMSDGFSYIPTLSHPHEEPAPWPGHDGFVQSVWTDGSLDEALGFHPSPDDTHVYLCGNPKMVEAMLEILTGEGFTEHSRRNPGTIHVEKFW